MGRCRAASRVTHGEGARRREVSRGTFRGDVPRISRRAMAAQRDVGYDGFRTDEQGAAAVNLPRKGATQREECAQRQKANSQPRPLRGP
jgi:hypothetical protein